MRMSNSHLHNKIKPLGVESSGFKTLPISGVKYNKYAYKVIFNSSLLDHKEVEYICTGAFQDEFVCFRDSLYIADYEDYVLALMFFEKHIESVSGPLNQNHVEILLSKYECVVRPNNWYKLYDCKMEIYITIAGRPNFKAAADEIISYIEPPYKVVKNNFWSLSIYNMFEHARLAEAMCKLSFPPDHLRMYITRCLVYRDSR